MDYQFISRSPEDLEVTAKEIVELFPDERVFTLFGAMGAGKTTFMKAMGKVLEVTDIVNSPTFALINVYSRINGDPVFHFDLYRIKSVTELYDIGYEEYLYSGNYCFMEWPEKMKELLPETYVYIHIEEQSDGHRLLTVRKIIE